jgi:hypothetical protein
MSVSFFNYHCCVLVIRDRFLPIDCSHELAGSELLVDDAGGGSGAPLNRVEMGSLSADCDRDFFAAVLPFDINELASFVALCFVRFVCSADSIGWPLWPLNSF